MQSLLIRTWCPPALLIAIALLAIGGCGGGGSDPGSDRLTLTQDQQASANPSASQFPAAKGKSLQELANLARPGPQLAPATQHYVPGQNRLAFGLVNENGQFIYAPSAVYIGRSVKGPAQGPFPAPTDSLLTEASFRSKQAALEGDAISSIYSAPVNVSRPGSYYVLVLTRTAQALLGATSRINVQANDGIPAAGDQAPAIHTETPDTTPRDLLETRDPPDQMHETDFANVIGKRPVALLFSTPALCQSRVCGPVTDIAAQLQAKYGDRMEFIHQEPYADNDLNKGVRPPLSAFNLTTEPWLFTFAADGRVAARLEGSFGVAEFERAVNQAL